MKKTTPATPIEKEIFKAFNPLTRRMQTIYLDEAEILEGEILIKMYWSRSIGKYVTIPGASLYLVNADLDLEQIAEAR
jgi:hypothetical protein